MTKWDARFERNDLGAVVESDGTCLRKQFPRLRFLGGKGGCNAQSGQRTVPDTGSVCRMVLRQEQAWHMGRSVWRTEVRFGGEGPVHAKPLGLDKEFFGLYSKCKRKTVRRLLKERRLGWCPWRWKEVRGFRAFWRQNMLLDWRWGVREGSDTDGFPSPGLELSIKVRQTVGGTGLDLNFRWLGLLKGQRSEVAQTSDVVKFNANKRNNSPSRFGTS